MTDEYGKYDVRALVARVVSGDMKAFIRILTGRFITPV